MKTSDLYSKTHPYFQADWDKLKLELAKRQVLDELQEAVRYLRENPPKKQKSSTKWESVQGCCDWDIIIRSLKTVRNNLFHGGKFPDESGPILDPVRDKKLLKTCIKVMKEIAEILPSEIRGACL